MRKIEVLALSGCMLLGGCLEVEQTVTLHADGSGTQEVRMVLREQLLAELEQQQAAAEVGVESDSTALFDEAKVRRELAEAGLELTSHAVKREDGKRIVAMAAAFPDFATLGTSPLSGSAAEWMLEPGPKPGLGQLTLFPQGREAWQKAREQATKMQVERDPLTEQFFRRQQQKLAGLDIVIRLRLPGKILMHTPTLQKTDANEVTAHITAGQIKTAADLVRRLAPRYRVIFDARATSLFE